MSAYWLTFGVVLLLCAVVIVFMAISVGLFGPAALYGWSALGFSCVIAANVARDRTR